MRNDLTVFAKDVPETRLVVEVKYAVTSPPERDPTVQRLARHMWGANCHYGLIITPSKTYVLRDDFAARGPESIRVTAVVPTGKLLGCVGLTDEGPASEQHLEVLAREWLERLVTSYEAALPDDPEVMRAFFPDLVGAVSDGRVVAEAAA